MLHRVFDPPAGLFGAGSFTISGTERLLICEPVRRFTVIAKPFP
jgi:hypothetical protein